MPIKISQGLEELKAVALTTLKALRPLPKDEFKSSLKQIRFVTANDLFKTSEAKTSPVKLAITKLHKTPEAKESKPYLSGYTKEVQQRLRAKPSAYLLPTVYISRKRCFNIAIKADGDLYQLAYVLKQGKTHLTAIQFKQIVQQLCLGVFDLHSNNLVHRDLKLENVYYTVRADGHFQIHIGDLDTVWLTTEKGTPKPSRFVMPCGSLPHMAPEMFQNPHQGQRTLVSKKAYNQLLLKPIDMYALGKTIQRLSEVTRLLPTERNQCGVLINQLLDSNPAKRLTINDIVLKSSHSAYAFFFNSTVHRVQPQPIQINNRSVIGNPKNRDHSLLIPKTIKQIYDAAAILNAEIDKKKPRIKNSYDLAQYNQDIAILAQKVLLILYPALNEKSLIKYHAALKKLFNEISAELSQKIEIEELSQSKHSIFLRTRVSEIQRKDLQILRNNSNVKSPNVAQLRF